MGIITLIAIIGLACGGANPTPTTAPQPTPTALPEETPAPPITQVPTATPMPTATPTPTPKPTPTPLPTLDQTLLPSLLENPSQYISFPARFVATTASDGNFASPGNIYPDVQDATTFVLVEVLGYAGESLNTLAVFSREASGPKVYEDESVAVHGTVFQPLQGETFLEPAST